MNNLLLRLPIQYADIERFCMKHHIKKLAFFGSVLREDFNSDSDVDVLVAFEEGHVPGWNIIGIRDELAQLVGKSIDFGTFNSVNPTYQATIFSTMQVFYESTG
jgi:uncharacterized protein